MTRSSPKRPRLTRSSSLTPSVDKYYDHQDASHADDNDDDLEFDLATERERACDKLRTAWDRIYAKYGRDLSNETDVVDVITGEIVEDRGHLSALNNGNKKNQSATDGYDDIWAVPHYRYSTLSATSISDDDGQDQDEDEEDEYEDEDEQRPEKVDMLNPDYKSKSFVIDLRLHTEDANSDDDLTSQAPIHSSLVLQPTGCVKKRRVRPHGASQNAANDYDADEDDELLTSPVRQDGEKFFIPQYPPPGFDIPKYPPSPSASRSSLHGIISKDNGSDDLHEYEDWNDARARAATTKITGTANAAVATPFNIPPYNSDIGGNNLTRSWPPNKKKKTRKQSAMHISNRLVSGLLELMNEDENYKEAGGTKIASGKQDLTVLLNNQENAKLEIPDSDDWYGQITSSASQSSSLKCGTKGYNCGRSFCFTCIESYK
ncbi:hypothetical protein V1514DRAFT_154737 [Lipomyces japonicus]|uniref:uncharacterized protein n=1 Tax=Lipomyces japonicus TaxID=56871 RepID=UPI0034CD36FE